MGSVRTSAWLGRGWWVREAGSPLGQVSDDFKADSEQEGALLSAQEWPLLTPPRPPRTTC